MYSIALGPRFLEDAEFVGAKCLTISTALDFSRNYVTIPYYSDGIYVVYLLHMTYIRTIKNVYTM